MIAFAGLRNQRRDLRLGAGFIQRAFPNCIVGIIGQGCAGLAPGFLR